MDKLVGKQKELDANNDGQISGQDFKLLRDAQNFRATAQEEIFDTTNLIIDTYDKKAINVFFCI